MTTSDHQSRDARLAEIRQQLAEGTYETPEKLEAAVDVILDRYEQDDLTSDASAPKHPR